MNRTLIPLALLGACAPAYAQTPCAGTTVTGLVHDSSAGLIPGATVTLDGSRQFEAGADGRFKATCVGTGSHQLKIKAEGFADLALPFRSPHAAALDLTLTPAIQASIDVDAEEEPPSVNAAGPTQTIAGKRLQALADDPDDLLKELQQMGATAGGNPANTSITVDGFQDSAQLPPKSSIAYIKVNPDVYSTEYSRAAFGDGGRVEIYTRPGQKAYHGALFTTNGSSWENAHNPLAASSAPIGKQRYGFEVAGPIRKVGSDFAATLEYRSLSNSAVIDTIQLNAAGAEVPVTGSVETPQQLWLPTARLDWQLSPKNTFIASYSGYLNSSQKLGVGGTTLAESGYNADFFDHTLRLTNITTASAHLMHETRASFRWVGENYMPASNAPQVQIAGAFTGGGASIGPQRIHEFRIEVDDDAILTTAYHTLKFGTQFFLNDEHRRLTAGFNGTYVFAGSTTAPALDASGHPIAGQTVAIDGLEQYRRAQLGLPGGTAYSYLGVAGNPELDFNQLLDAMFIQEDWNIGHGFHLSGGVRYAFQNAPVLLASATPRVGVQWAPGKGSRWSLRAHAGMFARDFQAADTAAVLRDDGVSRVPTIVYNAVYGAPVSAGATPTYTARRFATPLTNASVFAYHAGVTRSLPHGFSLSMDLGKSRVWNFMRSENINAPLDGTANGPRPLGPNLNLLEVQNSGQGRTGLFSFGIDQHTWKRVQFYAGGVRQNVFDNTDGNPLFSPQSARSDAGELVRRTGVPSLQLFGNGTFTLPAKIQLSGNYYASGGERYNITTGTDDNHDGNFNDRPQYAAPGTPGAVATPYGLLVKSGGIAPMSRNAATLPWSIFLDANLQRTFKITSDTKAEHQQSVTLNLRSSNVLNHTNVSAVGSVFGSPLFGTPYAAGNGRRVEVGARYSF